MRRRPGHRVRAARRARAADTRGMVVAVGLPVYHEKALYNCAALLVDGAIVGFVAKQFLAGDGIHYEPRWFKPWPAGEIDVLERARRHAAIRSATSCSTSAACASASRSARTPGSRTARAPISRCAASTSCCNPSASHFAFGKFAVRQRFVLEGSRAFGVALPLREPARQRGRPRHLRRRRPDRVGRRAASRAAAGSRSTTSSCRPRSSTSTATAASRRAAAAIARATTPRSSVVERAVRVAARKPAQAPHGASPTWEDAPARCAKRSSRARSRSALWDYLRKSRARGLRRVAVGRRRLGGVRGARRARGAARVRGARRRRRARERRPCRACAT